MPRRAGLIRWVLVHLLLTGARYARLNTAPRQDTPMSYTINVNGTPHTVDVDGDTPLLWVLRDTLDLKGSKFGCGMGLCGACTVHINGTATRSCITPISTVTKAQVTTIEGIGATDMGKK